MSSDVYDFLIIGAGQAGPPLAFDLVKAGKRVAIAERKHLGGSCVNFGCTPTKAAIASASLAHRARRASEFGIRIPTVEVDFEAVLARARSMAADFRQSIEDEFKPDSNPTLLRGHAKLVGRTTDGFRIDIARQTIKANQVVLDTGTRSFIPPIDGLDQERVIHAGNWLDRPGLPGHLLMLGGGYIGLEMAQFYRRMGSEVTVIEPADQVAGKEDPEIALAIQQQLEAEGIVFRLKTHVESARHDEGSVTLTVRSGNDSVDVAGTHLFVAAGRTPNTDDVGLESVGVTTNDHGFIEVDERLRTNVQGIWASGDIRGGPMFTHTAWDDYRILKSHLIGDGSRTTDRVLVYALFTEPQLGRVGMTQTQAVAAGRNLKIGRFEMSHNGRAIETGDEAGFIKVIVDAETDRILGAAVLAAEGAELVHMYADIMNADAPYTAIRDAIHIHPTLAEAVQSALSTLDA